MQRNHLILGFFLVMACAVHSFAAHAGVLEFFFPSLKEEEYDPSKEMVAEFAAGSGVKDKEKLEQLPVDAVPLVNPHLLTEEIGRWIMTVGGEAMNFEAGAPISVIDSKTALFDATAKQQYMKFLADNNIQKVMESGRYNIMSYVNEQPLLLNEGVVANRYRWLFRVPVVMTYLDKNIKTYKGNENGVIQNAILNIQIGRVIDAEHPDGLQIEQWSGKVVAYKEPEEKRPKTR